MPEIVNLNEPPRHRAAKKSVTLKDVADIAGVSKMTVSLILSDGQNSGRISESTRQRVLAASQQLGYYPSAVAKGLAGRRMNTIGVVLSHRFTTLRTDHYVSGLLDGIMSVLSAHDQDTMIFTGQGTSGGRPSLSVVGDGRCDGLILFSSDLNASLPTALREAGIPFTLINRLGTEVDVSSVTVDNASAMCQLVQHVIEQGHRRIAFLGGANTESAYERLAGYRQALEAAQIAYEPEWVTLESYERVSGHRRALQMLSLPRSHRPTALCCGSDMVALGAIEGLREAGLRVPEDVSVTGFDDVPEAATSVPALTTVHLPVAAIGTRAAEMLWEQISRESSDLRQEVLPTRLVLRASVAPPAETAV